MQAETRRSSARLVTGDDDLRMDSSGDPSQAKRKGNWTDVVSFGTEFCTVSGLSSSSFVELSESSRV